MKSQRVLILASVIAIVTATVPVSSLAQSAQTNPDFPALAGVNLTSEQQTQLAHIL